MSDCKKPDKLWDTRERYQHTPNRYEEIASMISIRSLFSQLGEKWRKENSSINYADLGCGEGNGTKFFSDFLSKIVGLPVKVTGVDASAKCADSCNERGIDFRNVELGVEPLGFSNQHIFTLFETIEHVFETDRLLESIRTSISQDGVLLVTTLNVVCLKNRILVPLGIQPFNTETSTKKLSYGYKFRFLRERMDTWKPAGHIRPFTLYSLCELIEDNGFTIVKTYGLENWRYLRFLEHISKNMCTGIFVVAKPK
jgi:SAM-dependent methyltransferase